MSLVGVEDVTLETEKLDLSVNFSTGPKVPGVYVPYVDYIQSYPSEDANNNQQLDSEDTNQNGRLDDGEDLNSDHVLNTEDADADGQLDSAGLQVATGGEPMFLISTRC